MDQVEETTIMILDDETSRPQPPEPATSQGPFPTRLFRAPFPVRGVRSHLIRREASAFPQEVHVSLKKEPKAFRQTWLRKK